jgi:hypothetical protein
VSFLPIVVTFILLNLVNFHGDKYSALYEGDLEADYLMFLAIVQKAAKENPVDVEFEFP